jgi:type I restriction enzyme S subunit
MNLEYKKLNEVLGYEQPTKYIVETTDYDDSFETPVLTAGKSFLLGYTEDKEGIFKNVPAIIFDDFTTSFHYVDFPFKVKSSAMKILTAKEDFVDLKYVYLQMKQVKIDTQLHKRYWISRFSNKEIPFPKIDIEKKYSKNQQAIAQILGDAAALRDKTKQLLTEYDLLAQSLFLDMFGDSYHNPKGFDLVKLNYFIDKLESGKSVNSTNDKYIIDEIGILKTSCVYDGVFDVSEAKVIREDELGKAKLNPKKDSIIISRMNTEELVGKSAYVDKDYNNLFLPDRLWQSVKSNVDYSVLWLSHAISQNSFMKSISRVATGTSGSMKNISQKKFLGLKIINPPIALQNQFAEKIDLIEQQKAIAKQELQESEDLFNCLLQKAFKGELV